MARIASNLTSALALCALVSGCTSFRDKRTPLPVVPTAAQDAPKVPLPLPEKSAVSAVALHRECPVTFDDARPPIEKLYHSGQTAPGHWRDAVTILPMESFQPSLNQLIEQQLLQSLTDAGRYESLVCSITSFQVALDERERGEEDLYYRYGDWQTRQEKKAAREARLEREEETRRRERVRQGQEHERKSMSDALAGALLKATVVAPVKARLARHEAAQYTTVYPQTIPMALTTGKQAGWNCCLEMKIKATSSDGHVREVPVQVATHLEKDDALEVNAQIQQVVMSAIDDLGNKVCATEL